ncbi:MAG: rhodanese-like domain-containing protein [Fibrobacteria bacterium]|nr:rhodanese-like domain-containing protein [Fibrobacteria bacterium]
MSFLSRLLAPFLPDPTATVDASTARDLLKLPSGERPKLIDVRTASEWKQGRLQGAVHIDVSASSFTEKIGSLPKESSYLLYCQSGGRSGLARSRMKSMGFRDVKHLRGGMGAWRAAKLPVAK